jgi:hypothetical protein
LLFFVGVEDVPLHDLADILLVSQGMLGIRRCFSLLDVGGFFVVDVWYLFCSFFLQQVFSNTSIFDSSYVILDASQHCVVACSAVLLVVGFL